MLKSFSIKQSFYFLFGVIFTGLVFTLVVNALSANTTTDRLEDVSQVSYPVLDMATSNNIQLIRLSEVIANAVTIGEEEVLDLANEILTEMLATYKKQSRLIPSMASTIDGLSQRTKQYHQNASTLAIGIINGDADFSVVPQQAAQNAKLLEGLQKDLAQFKADAEKSFNNELASVTTSVNDTLIANLIAGITIVFIISTVGGYISRSLLRSLSRITNSLSAIAQGEGDLTQRIKHDRNDELAQLVYWFNTFVEKLQGNIVNTIESVNALKDVASTLASSSHESFAQVSKQTETLEQTTLALEGLFDSVTAINESASIASQEAQQADNQAQQGQAVVSDTSNMISNLASEVQHSTEVVNKLDGFANNVTAIVSTIQGIAEQTNLLALNAAIEAARAGEQGRGFAVVADEVRTLASRTQQSTLEIRQVIEELVTTSDSAVQAMDKGQKTAEQSVELSSEASVALNLITEKVDSIVQANSSIADATMQQKDASEQIQTFVIQLDNMSKEAEKNMSNLDQVSHSIKDITEQLDEVTGQFKV